MRLVRNLARLLCLAGLWLLAACSATRSTLELRQSPPEHIPPRVELEAVPFFAQQDYQCGPAALATVLQYQGSRSTPDELVEQVYVPALKGSLQAEMLASVRRHAMAGYVIQAELDTLFEEVAAGHPVLLLQNLGLSMLPQWHYSVLIGYDLQREEVFLRSGTRQRWVSDFSAFDRTLERAGRWAVVVLLPQQTAVTAEPLATSRIAYELERLGHHGAAQSLYRAAIRRWPQEAVPVMALANLQYSLAEYAAAEQTLRHWLALHPEASDAWNNLAYILRESGCAEQAIQAARCAVEWMPGEKGYADTLQEMQSTSTIDKGSHCAPVHCPGESTR